MKIMAGLLESPEGVAAQQRAVEEARLHGGDLLLVTYVPSPHDAGSSRHYDEDRQRALRDAEGVAAQLRETGLQVEIRAPIGANSPADALLQAAKDDAVDLIVIGIRRRSRVGKLIVGSNAQEILLAADAPVLAVKPEVGG